jgi:hypothetical protein
MRHEHDGRGRHPNPVVLGNAADPAGGGETR